MSLGLVYGCLGVALVMVGTGIGSCIGVGRAGQMAGGILSKDPSRFGSMFVLQLLPSTQSIYGLIISFMALNSMGILSGGAAGFDANKGLMLLCVCLPIAVIGLVSAVFQGKVAMAGMELCVKQKKQMGRAMTMAALVEIFAIFAFVISLLGVINIK